MLLELGDHEDHDHRDDADGDADDDAGIDHGADDFFLELGGLFHEVGQAGEDQVEHAAHFAGVDHVDVELVESLGIFGHGVGEGSAAFDFIGDAADDRLEQAGLLLLLRESAGCEEWAGRHPEGWKAGG